MFNMYQDFIFTTFTSNPQKQEMIKIMARKLPDMLSDTYVDSWIFKKIGSLKILDAIRIYKILQTTIYHSMDMLKYHLITNNKRKLMFHLFLPFLFLFPIYHIS